MKKIFIDKNAPIASVVERIIEIPDRDVVLVIPRGARIKEFPENFSLLRREAAAGRKKLHIESVDEGILSLASEAGISTEHPMFAAAAPDSPRAMNDILPAIPPRSTFEKEEEPPRRFFRERQPEPERTRVDELEEELAEELEAPLVHRRKDLFARISRRGVYKRAAVLIAVFLVVLSGLWGIGKVFGKANITLSFQKTPWEYEGQFLASKTISKVNPKDNALPAEVINQDRNITQLFPASGKAQVAYKAAGKITIYNAYSSDPQTLVATTRFVTPDGKIFRLDSTTKIPGAEIKDGKIQAANIVADVSADKAGDAYNIGPVAKLTIPGFEGSPKHEGFYGALFEGARGGFVGEKQVPTENDILLAKEKTSSLLTQSFGSTALGNRPAGLTVPDGASQVSITKLTVNKNTDETGHFSVYAEARFKAVGFREADMQTILRTLALPANKRMTIRDLTLEYGSVKPDFEQGTLSFKTKAGGVLMPEFSMDDFIKSIAGKPVVEAESIMLRTEGLLEGKISVSPQWVSTVPKETDRIHVETN